MRKKRRRFFRGSVRAYVSWGNIVQNQADAGRPLFCSFFLFSIVPRKIGSRKRSKADRVPSINIRQEWNPQTEPNRRHELVNLHWKSSGTPETLGKRSFPWIRTDVPKQWVQATLGIQVSVYPGKLHDRTIVRWNRSTFSAICFYFRVTLYPAISLQVSLSDLRVPSRSLIRIR